MAAIVRVVYISCGIGHSWNIMLVVMHRKIAVEVVVRDRELDIWVVVVDEAGVSHDKGNVIEEWQDDPLDPGLGVEHTEGLYCPY